MKLIQGLNGHDKVITGKMFSQIKVLKLKLEKKICKDTNKNVKRQKLSTFWNF